MKISICAIGECMIEITNIKNNLYNFSIAGDTLNFLTYLKKNNFKKFYLTAIGDSDININVLNFLESKKININFVSRNISKEIGLYLIKNKKSGEKEFYYWRDYSAAKFFFNNLPKNYKLGKIHFNYIYLTGVTLSLLENKNIEKFINFINFFKKKQSKIIFDLNLRPKRWIKKNLSLSLKKILNITDILFASGEDLTYWKGENKLSSFEVLLNNYNITHGVYRKNARMSYAFYNNKKYMIKNKYIKSVIDTSGAGDGFNAIYISNFLESKNPLKALQEASLVGAKIVMKKGAIVDV